MDKILARLGKSIADLKSAATSAQTLKIDLSQNVGGPSFVDYKQQRSKYYVNRFSKALTATQKCLEELEEHQKTVYPLTELQNLFGQIQSSSQENDFTQLVKKLDVMQKLVPQEGKPQQPQKFEIPPTLPRAIADDLTADIRELEKCYESGCNRSAIILCGRILETALHRKYYEHTSNDLLETSPGIGLGKIIAKMSNAQIPLPVGLNEQIHLINNVRIVSVHKKKQLFTPSQEQTLAIILYTIDTLNSIF